ncbi:MAG: hypothetical protein COA58_13305 [Bacteroidetes bacterium]|nr:MAG: hypothetical protein COA58_13305 [Bacteroidota bacterium]
MTTHKSNWNTDSKLIYQIKTGGLSESHAISELLKNNKNKIMGMIKNYNGSEEEAEDVLIEGVTEVVFHIKSGRFKENSSLATYLFRISRLIWFQKFRSGKVEYFNEELPSDITLSVQAKMEYSADKKFFSLLLEVLGEKCKQVLSMWSEGFNMTEIQKKIGYANSQIAMNKKSKCLVKLKKLVKNNHELSQTLADLR